MTEPIIHKGVNVHSKGVYISGNNIIINGSETNDSSQSYQVGVFDGFTVDIVNYKFNPHPPRIDFGYNSKVQKISKHICIANGIILIGDDTDRYPDTVSGYFDESRYRLIHTGCYTIAIAMTHIGEQYPHSIPIGGIDLLKLESRVRALENKSN
jgi:hypothetical protein